MSTIEQKKYTMKTTIQIKSFLIVFFVMLPTVLFADSQKIVITEFMAINSNGIVDEDGEHSDWLELYNNTDGDINLNSWYLSDNAAIPNEWQFPSIVIQKGSYLIVFASGKNRTDPTKNLHTNFKLSGSGEYLAICEPDMTISSSYSPTFPAQRQDISFGLYLDQQVFFSTATPGAKNLVGSLPFAPNFSEKRGFYKTAFDVTLTLPSGDGAIYYTTNGTRPTKTTGLLYQSPVRIKTTTPLSAVTINSNNLSSEIVTNTYIFTDSVIKQPTAPIGYPTSWKQENTTTEIVADYQMDPRVTTNPAYKDLMETSLKAIPSLILVTDIRNLFSNINNATTGGIYIYTGIPSTVGANWARPTSVEYFDPASNKGFQLNCELQLHGGMSRNPANSPKHGFELSFKSAYGPSKLNFNLFDEKNVTNEFNGLVLRAGYNYTWTKNLISQQTNAQYIMDSWAKNAQLDMGQPAAHEKFVHLYINGLYWGLYNISEEINKDFMQSYFGGQETDYDVIKEKQTTTPTDGTMVAWNALKNQISTVETNANYQAIQGKDANGTINTSISNLLDIDNYIDYMLVNYYIGNSDWDTNNWSTGRNRITNDAGFRFFCWDAETSMIALSDNKIMTGTAGNPTAFMQYLKKNEDFKVRIADRIQTLLINAGGAMTPDVSAARYIKLADEIDMAIISESARWSDWYAPYSPYTKIDHWLPRKNDLLTNYFPNRTNTLISQLKSASLFPSISAPTFSHNGGNISTAVNLGMNTSTGTIYYTTDGSDPRTPITGTVSSTASSYTNTLSILSSVTVKARVKTNKEWSAIKEVTFVFNNTTDPKTPFAEQLAFGNNPNPFHESTRIHYILPYEGNVQLSIYSIDGRLIEDIYNGNALAGYNQFYWSPKNIKSGIYICRIFFSGQNAYLKFIFK
jgi:hypothetical protein